MGKRKFGRKINGKTFFPQVTRKTKTAAKDTAANFRRKGNLARVTKEKSFGGWVVWVGPKRKK